MERPPKPDSGAAGRPSLRVIRGGVLRPEPDRLPTERSHIEPIAGDESDQSSLVGAWFEPDRDTPVFPLERRATGTPRARLQNTDQLRGGCGAQGGAAGAAEISGRRAGANGSAAGANAGAAQSHRRSAATSGWPVIGWLGRVLERRRARQQEEREIKRRMDEALERARQETLGMKDDTADLAARIRRNHDTGRQLLGGPRPL